MEFVVIANDYQDEKAFERRMSVREKHLQNANKLFEEGKLIFASALLDDKGKMNGSVMFVNFSSEEELKREWLEKEIYVTGDVWEKIEIRKAKVAKH